MSARSRPGRLLSVVILAAFGSGAAVAAPLPECRRSVTDELSCLACNVYHEARDQPEQGQIAVAMVTLNRLRSPDRPKTLCDVVWERGRDQRSGRTVAQFSWTLDREGAPIAEAAAWRKAVEIAETAMLAAADPSHPLPDPTQGALFFHASSITPNWAGDPALVLATGIGDHLFYRQRKAVTGGTGATIGTWRRNWPTTLPVPADVDAPPNSMPKAKLIHLARGGDGKTIMVVSRQGGSAHISHVGMVERDRQPGQVKSR